MMKKRMLALVLCALMAVSLLSACGNGAGTTTPPDTSTDPTPPPTTAAPETTPPPVDTATPPTERLKITLASFPDQPKAAFEAAIAAANLDFDVEIIEYPQAEYETKIKQNFSGTPTDLVLMDGPNVAFYANSGVLEPLNSYWDPTDFQDLVGSAQSAMQWNGSIWAAPLNESNTVLWYNKKVFDELKIEVPTKVDDAWTFEKLAEVCDKIVKEKAGMFAIQPQMFTMDQKNEGMTFTEQLWVWMAGGDFLSPDGKTASGYMDSAETKRGLQFYADLYTKGYASTDAIPNAFETEKVAMWINGPWMLGVWKDQFPDFYNGGWGAMPMPRDKQGASGSGSWNIAISAKSAHKAEAWQAIQAITGKAGQAIWCDKTGNLPARKSVLESSPTYKEYPYDIINEQLVKTAHARPVTPFYPAISEATINLFADLAFGESVDDSVAKALTKMNEALKG